MKKEKRKRRLAFSSWGKKGDEHMVWIFVGIILWIILLVLVIIFWEDLGQGLRSLSKSFLSQTGG